MKTLFEHSLYSFHLLDEANPIIQFDWTAKSKEMEYEDFKTACTAYAGFAWEHQAKYLLVDTRSFQFQLPSEFETWREQELNPRYYRLGVLKFAYVTKPEYLPFMKDIPAQPGKFETKNFTSIPEALLWLNLSE